MGFGFGHFHFSELEKLQCPQQAKAYNKKKTPRQRSFQKFHTLYIRGNDLHYIMPIPAPAPAGIAGVSSLMLATTDSVVSSVDATLVAF